MSYGSGENTNYSYDASNTGGYTGYDDNVTTPSYGGNDYNSSYNQGGGNNPFGEEIAAPAATSNPFDNFGDSYAPADAPVGGGQRGFSQYEVFGDNSQFSDQDYSLTSGGEEIQYNMPSTHASPDVLAENMQLPVPSGPESTTEDILGYPSQEFGGVAYGQGGSNKKKKKKKKKKYSWYELGYYKALFDFDTDEIGRRLLGAINPVVYSKFWQENKSRPDLYVPVWGTTTLWFLLVLCGTIGSYLTNDDCSSKVEFDKVGWGALATYGYIWFPPLLWLILFKFWVDVPLGLFDNVCIYGYSLLPYLPTMFIGLMPYKWIRWIPFGISCALSCYFLVANYAQELKDHMKQGVIIMGIMVLLNVGLCILYKMYFFETC